MKILLPLFLVLATTASHSAFAGANQAHHFWCAVNDRGATKQVHFKIKDEDLLSSIGEVTVAELVDSETPDSPLQDCGIIDGPCEKISETRWVVSHKSTVRAELDWDLFRGRPAITGMKLNLGRSGAVSAKMTAPFDKYGAARGAVQANLYKFNFPRGVAAECSYFRQTGVRPGLSGGN